MRRSVRRPAALTRSAALPSADPSTGLSNPVPLSAADRVELLLLDEISKRFIGTLFDDFLRGRVDVVRAGGGCVDCSSHCDGSCSGGCDGNCKGGCDGNCRGDCISTCKGDCSGSAKGEKGVGYVPEDPLARRLASVAGSTVAGVNEVLVRYGYRR